MYCSVWGLMLYSLYICTCHTACFQKKSGTVAYLKAVAKVNVQQLARVAVQHEVGGVAIPQPQQVPHHAHHSCAASVPRSSLQPHFAVAAFQPQHLMQVLACQSVSQSRNLQSCLQCNSSNSSSNSSSSSSSSQVPQTEHYTSKEVFNKTNPFEGTKTLYLFNRKQLKGDQQESLPHFPRRLQLHAACVHSQIAVLAAAV